MTKRLVGAHKPDGAFAGVLNEILHVVLQHPGEGENGLVTGHPVGGIEKVLVILLFQLALVPDVAPVEGGAVAVNAEGDLGGGNLAAAEDGGQDALIGVPGVQHPLAGGVHRLIKAVVLQEGIGGGEEVGADVIEVNGAVFIGGGELNVMRDARTGAEELILRGEVFRILQKCLTQSLCPGGGQSEAV